MWFVQANKKWQTLTKTLVYNAAEFNMAAKIFIIKANGLEFRNLLTQFLKSLSLTNCVIEIVVNFYPFALISMKGALSCEGSGHFQLSSCSWGAMPFDREIISEGLWISSLTNKLVCFSMTPLVWNLGVRLWTGSSTWVGFIRAYKN